MTMLKRLLTIGVVAATSVWMIGLAFVYAAGAQETTLLKTGTLIKGSGRAVYYYAFDFTRYTFPTEDTFFSWYPDFSNITTISDTQLGEIPLRGNITMRPGTYLIKVSSVPKVFAIEFNGYRRHIGSEAAAITLYGPNWAQRIVDIPDGFYDNYPDYTPADPITGTEYPEGQLVKTADSADIYQVNRDGSWSKFLTDAAFTGSKFRQEFVVTAPAAMVHTTGPDISYASNCMYIPVPFCGL